LALCVAKEVGVELFNLFIGRVKATFKRKNKIAINNMVLFAIMIKKPDK